MLIFLLQLRGDAPGAGLLSPNAIDPSEELFGEPTAEKPPNEDDEGKCHSNLKPAYYGTSCIADDLAVFAEQLKSAQKSAKKRYETLARCDCLDTPAQSAGAWWYANTTKKSLLKTPAREQTPRMCLKVAWMSWGIGYRAWVMKTNLSWSLGLLACPAHFLDKCLAMGNQNSQRMTMILVLRSFPMRWNILQQSTAPLLQA